MTADQRLSSGEASRETYPILDTLRAFAIVLVLGTHAEGVVGGGLYGADGMLPWWRAVLYSGHAGVGLFFVLSAFLLSLPFWRVSLGGPEVSVRTFLWRRAWRVVPMYALAVVATAWWVGGVSGLWRAAPYLCFLPGSVISDAAQLPGTFAGVWWSLATEVQFYVLLALGAVVCRTGGRWRTGMVFLTAVVAYVTLVFEWWPPMQPAARRYDLLHSAIGRAPLFLAGILSGGVYVRFGGTCRRMLVRAPSGLGDVLLVLLVVGFVATLAAVHRTVSYLGLESAYPLWQVAEAVVWATLILGAMIVPLRWERLWTAASVVWIGQVSYSIYLLHMPVFWYGSRAVWLSLGVPSGWSLSSLAIVMMLMAVVLALSTLTFYAIERPAMRIGRRRWRRRSAEHAVDASPTVRSAA